MKNNDLIVIPKNESNNKLDCFARLSKIKCNALKKKECKTCTYYKKRSEVSNYEKYVSKKDLVEWRKNI